MRRALLHLPVALLAVSAAAVANVAPPLRFPAAPALVGPPLLCHPIDIGTAKSLPWGVKPFARSPDYDTARTVDDTLAILRESQDTLVHMETLRRATIYLVEMEDANTTRSDAWSAEQVGRLVAALQAETTAIQGQATATAADGLRLFDLGYFMATVVQTGRSKLLSCSHETDSAAALSQAALLRPDDGALHLGIALTLFDHPKAPAKCYAHLERSMALATDAGGLLRRNILSTMGRMLEADSYDDLAAKVATHTQRA